MRLLTAIRPLLPFEGLDVTVSNASISYHSARYPFERQLLNVIYENFRPNVDAQLFNRESEECATNRREPRLQKK